MILRYVPCLEFTPRNLHMKAYHQDKETAKRQIAEEIDLEFV